MNLIKGQELLRVPAQQTRIQLCLSILSRRGARVIWIFRVRPDCPDLLMPRVALTLVFASGGATHAEAAIKGTKGGAIAQRAAVLNWS